jgi:hypothetical protein
MIGHFREVHEAEKAKELIDRFTDLVRVEPESYQSDAGPEARRFSEEMAELMKESGIFIIGPSELEQFTYDIRVDVKGSDVVVNTDESEVSAFLKLLIEKGAKVEVYSAHNYPDKE